MKNNIFKCKFLLYINSKKSLKIPTGNPNSYIEGQTTQWSNERGQTDKQWTTKDTHKTNILEKKVPHVGAVDLEY
jgi:hypothetical protein